MQPLLPSSSLSDDDSTLILRDFVSLQEATRQQGKGHNSDRTRLVISSACPTSQCPGIVFGRYFTLVSLHLWRCLRFNIDSVSLFHSCFPSSVEVPQIQYRQCGSYFCFATDTGTLTSGGSSVSVHRQYGGLTLLCSNRDRSHKEHAPNDVVGKVPVRSCSECHQKTAEHHFVDRQCSSVPRCGLSRMLPTTLLGKSPSEVAESVIS